LADLIRIQIKIEDAATNLELLELKRKPLVSDFNTYLNRSVDSEVDISNPLPEHTITSSLDSALANNPKIKANQKEIAGADTQLKLAELKRRPNIGVGLDYVMISERKDMALADNGKDALMPMVSLSLPVFGKKNRSLIKETELVKESLSLQNEGIQNDIKNQWVKAEYLESTSSRELELYEREIRNTRSLLNVLTSEYSNNSSNFEELLMTQQQLLQLQIAQVKAMTKQHQAWLQKRYLTGNFLTIKP
jgi:outer membrane protein TolC